MVFNTALLIVLKASPIWEPSDVILCSSGLVSSTASSGVLFIEAATLSLSVAAGFFFFKNFPIPGIIDLLFAVDLLPTVASSISTGVDLTEASSVTPYFSCFDAIDILLFEATDFSATEYPENPFSATETLSSLTLTRVRTDFLDVLEEKRETLSSMDSKDLILSESSSEVDPSSDSSSQSMSPPQHWKTGLRGGKELKVATTIPTNNAKLSIPRTPVCPGRHFLSPRLKSKNPLNESSSSSS
mmetsp:Transcript_1395/g.3214  ORF Transcript_1395/g.3214 Transcript_1395/m.3214 type:complete len:243 (+) Transcript_1395:784-1512(+)